MFNNISTVSLRVGAIAAAAIALSASALAATGSSHSAPRKPIPDLADTVKGDYYGDIISDSRGSSQSDVTVTVTKVGRNTVKVVSSERLPAFTVHLTRAMQTIQQSSGDNVFLVDQSKNPWSLDVSVDGTSWSGARQ